MSDLIPWHEDERFWECWRKWSFSDKHWESARAEVDQILALTNPAPGSAILDLCCGPGRHSLELARRGFAVTGVDRTESYLDEARRRAGDEGLCIEFVRSGMGEFCAPNMFDGAINMFTAFGYFEDEASNQRVLSNLYHSLRDGGVLLMELAGKEAGARKFTPKDWTEQNGVVRLLEQKIIGDWSFVESRWIYLTETERIEFTLKLWLYSAKELADMLREAGFRSVTAFGGLDGSPYDENAKRLVVVARK